jgi:protein ImuB
MTRILCLRFPNWPLQRLVAARRELRESASTRAMILTARDPRRGDVVRCCSASAWSAGVRLEMPLSEARSLVRGGETYVAEYDPQADRRWLARIAAWGERYSPLVGWETIASGRKEVLQTLPCPAEPEALLLDVTGIGRLFGSEASLAEDLRIELSRRGFNARIGIAQTIGAAWATAVSRAGAAVTIVPPGDAAQAIAPLPVAGLRLAADAVDILQRLGVLTIGQLLALSRSELAARLGAGLMLRIDQALGHAQELIQAHHPQPAFETQWLFEHPTQRREEIELVLAQLVERLAGQLQREQQGAMRLACRLDCAGHPPLRWEAGLYRPTADPRHLKDLIALQLERLHWRGEIGRIGLRVELAAPLESHQLALFDGASQQSQRAAALLLDRLSSRLGSDAVLSPRFVPDALPERQVRLEPVTGRAVLKKRPRARKSQAVENAGAATAIPLAASYRPLFLLPVPLELAVVAVLPDGPPAQFSHDGQLHRVARCTGPERIETGWWRGGSVRRDYYRVETTAGLRYWLFRQLPAGRWFLHGVFE